MPPDKSAPARRRESLREMLWPGSRDWVWSRNENQGFVTIPRLLPLILHLIKRLADKGDPTLVYLELWSRVYDEGIITVADEEKCAYAAGYTGTRALRTWREHVFLLRDLGFLLIKREGNREIGHILLLNPLAMCARLNAEGKTPDGWWAAFAHRASEIGATIPQPLRPVDQVSVGRASKTPATG